MNHRTIGLHTFCSVKGGVGKSTLAVACAKLLAARGRVPVLIDAGLTGTSLADGLKLLAPNIPLRPDGGLDLDAAPSGEFYSLDETIALRSARKSEARADPVLPPAYLNDALTYRGTDPRSDCRVDGMLWRHEREDGVRYLPSSPLATDVEVSLGWIYGAERMPEDLPFRWLHRFTWILDALIERVAKLTDVVVDLPPGVWGFSHEILVLVSLLSRGQSLPEGYPSWSASLQWNVNPFLVVTPDRNDLRPALEYLAINSDRLPTLVPLVNRVTDGIADLRATVRRYLGPVPSALGIEDQLRTIDSLHSTLGRVFLDQDLAMNDAVRKLSASLRLEALL